MLILQTEEEREVMPGKADAVEKANRRLLLAMHEAGKSMEFMAGVLHVNTEEIKTMLYDAEKAKQKRVNIGDHILREWDKMHMEYVKYRESHQSK